ncbi:MAG TPA: LEA type 2 family protein [Nitrososphaeraceae archaeon]|nr:LEA type 2 family protein [Nitrososphaeraceae archaeon]
MENKIAGVIATIALVLTIIYPTNINGNFQLNDVSKLGMTNMNFVEASIFNFDAVKDSVPPELSIKNITTNIVDDKTGNLSIIFDVYNPNKITIMIESISYNVYSNSTRLVSGDIGQRPEGFIDSQDSIFPVIGNGTLILKDKKIIDTNRGLNLSQIATNNGTSQFLVNGTYFFKQTSSFQSTGGEGEFSIVYPKS